MTIKTDIENAKRELIEARTAFVNAKTQQEHDACLQRVQTAAAKVRALHPSGIMR